jgi:hypothetical protein
MPIDLPLCRGRDEGLARDSNKRMMATGRFWPDCGQKRQAEIGL